MKTSKQNTEAKDSYWQRSKKDKEKVKKVKKRAENKYFIIIFKKAPIRILTSILNYTGNIIKIYSFETEERREKFIKDGKCTINDLTIKVKYNGKKLIKG